MGVGLGTGVWSWPAQTVVSSVSPSALCEVSLSEAPWGSDFCWYLTSSHLFFSSFFVVIDAYKSRNVANWHQAGEWQLGCLYHHLVAYFPKVCPSALGAHQPFILPPVPSPPLLHRWIIYLFIFGQRFLRWHQTTQAAVLWLPYDCILFCLSERCLLYFLSVVNPQHGSSLFFRVK